MYSSVFSRSCGVDESPVRTAKSGLAPHAYLAFRRPMLIHIVLLGSLQAWNLHSHQLWNYLCVFCASPEFAVQAVLPQGTACLSLGQDGRG
jgi:hypothetical protein